MTSSGGNSRTYSRESDCHGDTKTHRRRRHGLPVSVSSCWGLAPGFCRDDRDGDGRSTHHSSVWSFHLPRSWLKTPGWAGLVYILQVYH